MAAEEAPLDFNDVIAAEVAVGGEVCVAVYVAVCVAVCVAVRVAVS